MRAVQLTSLVKGPQELGVSDVPDPVPKSNEYLIEIRACGANFFDTLQIRGKYQNQPPFPWVAGAEFSGVVLSAPSNGRFKVGDRVFGGTQGAFATKICAPDAELQAIPDGWSFQEASALYLTGPTSYCGLALRAQAKAGDWILVHGAAGGVGLAAIQVGKALGAKVIATATTARNIAVCKRFGADHVVDYVATPQWEVEVMKITNKHGADVIFDPIGNVAQDMKCTAFSGRIVVVGFVGGEIEAVKVNRVLLKNIAVVGLHWGAYTQHDPKTIPEVWAGLFKLIAAGKFRGTVFQPDDGTSYHGLESCGRALQTLEEKKSWGKVVVDVPVEGPSKL